MFVYFRILMAFILNGFKSRARLEAEILALRHQLVVLRRQTQARPKCNRGDRLFFALLYKFFLGVLNAMHIMRPETVVRWHRMGFRALWRWKSQPLGGRPKVSRDIRDLIREMSLANPLWGAPRIHGELKMLGIKVAQSTVGKYKSIDLF